MKRLLLPFLLSCAGAIILFIGAGMAGGACHCMTPMFTLFPYGSFVMMRWESDSIGLSLALLQFPFYAMIITLAKGARWKTIVVLLFVVLHGVAASLALRDYCESRRTCAITPARQLLFTSVESRPTLTILKRSSARWRSGGFKLY